ncbi:MAG: hypothetical protein NUV93_04405 [Firmicutes bacterium]|jgi:hypothetical protein|nr:hypothetical protein [Bacillota bacterium]
MYWERPGKQNTHATLAAAVGRAREIGATHIVVASGSGYTALAAADMVSAYPDMVLVVVTHHTGFTAPGVQEMPSDVRLELASRGAQVLTTTHLFGNVERAVTSRFGGLYPGGVIANTLRMFGKGVKVCVEIATMALDAGLIPYGREVVAVAGTGSGADSAIVIIPAHAKDFFDGQILEVICKPRRAAEDADRIFRPIKD